MFTKRNKIFFEINLVCSVYGYIYVYNIIIVVYEILIKN